MSESNRSRLAPIISAHKNCTNNNDSETRTHAYPRRNRRTDQELLCSLTRQVKDLTRLIQGMSTATSISQGQVSVLVLSHIAAGPSPDIVTGGGTGTLPDNVILPQCAKRLWSAFIFNYCFF